MDVMLPADLAKQVEKELASGHYRTRDELIEQAVRHFFDELQRGRQRLDALFRIGQAVDRTGLYKRVLIPGQDDWQTARGSEHSERCRSRVCRNRFPVIRFKKRFGVRSADRRAKLSWRV
jgi:Arc/MetJ-type ribon-helix-helix transcriptional regulator